MNTGRKNDVMTGNDGPLSVSTMKVRGCGTVMVNGSRWVWVFDDHWLLAHKGMATPPKEMPRISGRHEANARSLLVRTVTPVATFTFGEVMAFAAEMARCEVRVDKTATLQIERDHLAWSQLSNALALMHDSESATLSIITGDDGLRMLRFDTPTIRFVLMPYLPEDGAPCTTLLGREVADVMARATAGGSA